MERTGRRRTHKNGLEPPLTIVLSGQIEAHELRNHASKGSKSCRKVYLVGARGKWPSQDVGVKWRRTSIDGLHGRLLVITCHSNHNVEIYSHLHGCHKRRELSKRCDKHADAHIDTIGYVDKLYECHLLDNCMLAALEAANRGWGYYVQYSAPNVCGLSQSTITERSEAT